MCHINRRSVARGVALGLFGAFLIPLVQTPAAALLAFSVRANVLAAAAATLVTNPLTFPPIYFKAYKCGRLLLGSVAQQALSEGQITVAWTQQMGRSVIDITLPIALGLLVFAVVSLIVGYCSVSAAWRIWKIRHWRRRMRLRLQGRRDDTSAVGEIS